ncbi:hypothetical protein HZS_3553 [Henneguya salminicola]|nr:hypothetical protein HZS_3553 [Henneguya salminicola]
MSLLEQKNRIFYTTISPFIDSMVENFTKSSLSACFDFVYCAANNYYENESEEIKIYMAQTIMQDKLNFFLQKFMISKSKLYSIEHTEKNHKIRKNDIMHGISKKLSIICTAFTKPELIHENTQFILGSVANRLLGYSEARGRIYTRHSNLFVYKCDKEDKKVLFKTGRVNRIIGRVGLFTKLNIDSSRCSKRYRYFIKKASRLQQQTYG